MDRRTAIATARTTARRIRTLSSKVAIRMGREVSERLAARRTAAPSPPAPASAAPPPPAARSDAGSPEASTAAAPSPADVARVVQRNAAGLPHRSAVAQRMPTPRPRSAPGAKLPARAGRGILGV